MAAWETETSFRQRVAADPRIAKFMNAAALDHSARELSGLARRLDERGRPEGYPLVVLVGPTNAGKSRLFNALAGFDRS